METSSTTRNIQHQEKRSEKSCNWNIRKLVQQQDKDLELSPIPRIELFCFCWCRPEKSVRPMSAFFLDHPTTVCILFAVKKRGNKVQNDQTTGTNIWPLKLSWQRDRHFFFFSRFRLKDSKRINCSYTIQCFWVPGAVGAPMENEMSKQITEGTFVQSSKLSEECSPASVEKSAAR